MGIQPSTPKYYLSVRDGSGQDGTDVWNHTANAYDEDVLRKFVSERNYPPRWVYLTPKPVFSWFAAYPGGSHSNQTIYSELYEMPLSETPPK